jgi:hypothetical protein
MYLVEQYLQQRTIEVNIYMKLSHMHVEPIFEVIHGRCVISKKFPDLPSTNNDFAYTQILERK